MSEATPKPDPEPPRPSLGRELRGLGLLYLVMAGFATVVAFQCVAAPS